MDGLAHHAGPRIYSCCNCRCHVSDHDDIISKCFQVLLLLFLLLLLRLFALVVDSCFYLLGEKIKSCVCGRGVVVRVRVCLFVVDIVYALGWIRLVAQFWIRWGEMDNKEFCYGFLRKVVS